MSLLAWTQFMMDLSFLHHTHQAIRCRVKTCKQWFLTEKERTAHQEADHSALEIQVAEQQEPAQPSVPQTQSSIDQSEGEKVSRLFVCSRLIDRRRSLLSSRSETYCSRFQSMIRHSGADTLFATSNSIRQYREVTINGGNTQRGGETTR